MRTTSDLLWIESRGRTAEIGLTAAALAGRTLTRVETVGKNAKLRPGGAFLLLTFGKGRTAQEVEVDAPVAGKIVEIEPGLAKAVTGVAAVAAAPERTWIVRVELAQAVADDDEEDDEPSDDDLLDDDDDDDDA